MTVDDDRGGGRKENSYIVLYKFNGESQNSIIIDIRIYPLEKKLGSKYDIIVVACKINF